jgi:hypothetical protein
MDAPIETIEYKDHIIEIYLDDNPLSPIDEFDMMGKMVCWHSRYDLGHEQPNVDPNEYRVELAKEYDSTVRDRIEYWERFEGWQQIANKYKDASALADKAVEERVNKIINKAIDSNYILLPLYLYDHSVITISTGPFNCPWDSGQVGFIYVSKENVKKEFNWKKLNKNRIDKVVDILKSEVKLYDDYLTGNVYGFNVKDPNENDLDSCWGFYGDFEESGLLDMAKSAIDTSIETLNEERIDAQLEEVGDMSQLNW